MNINEVEVKTLKLLLQTKIQAPSREVKIREEINKYVDVLVQIGNIDSIKKNAYAISI